MGHLRLPNHHSSTLDHRAQGSRGGSSRPRVFKDGTEYLFTPHIWQAMAYLSGAGQNLILEAGYVDPNGVFPRSVMRGVDYAVSKGAVAHVTAYTYCGGDDPIGAILTLSWGDRELGVYAVVIQIPRDSEIKGMTQ